jgi:osmotically-inducible protein OsmY
MKRPFVLAPLLITALLPFALPGQQKAANPDDRISDQIRMRLATDADVKGGNDEVIVKNGVVTITGRVDSERGKNKATRLAKKVKGVKSVDNQLVIGPPAG